MATTDQNALNRMENQADELSSKLSSSPSAYARGTSPTSKDLSSDVRLRGLRESIEKANSDRLRERWYGKESTQETATGESGAGEGLLAKGLNILSRPVYSAVGAAEWALGKGSKKGFFENIDANVQEKELAGDLLRKMGVNSVAAAPLGFMLDVALDPLNWATAGTAALLPRVAFGAAKGFTKGGITGAARGVADAASSNILKKAAITSRFVPFAGTKFGAVKAAEGVTEKAGTSLREMLAKRSSAAGANFDTTYGVRTVEEVLKRSAERKRVGDVIENAIKKLPNGETVIRTFKYSPADWMKQARLKDKLLLELQREKRILTVDETGKAIVRDTDAALDALETASPGQMESARKGFNSVDEAVPESIVNQMKNIAEEGKSMADDSADYARSNDAVENARRILGEHATDAEIRDIVEATQHLTSKTGVTSYDNMMTWLKDKKVDFAPFKMKNVPLLKNTIEAYENFINIFKTMKVGLSPSAYVNATVGNPTMAAMGAGISFILRPEFRNNVWEASKFLRGKQGPEYIIDTFFNNANSWANLMRESAVPGNTFSRSFGFGPRDIGAKFFGERAIQTAKDVGVLNAKNKSQVLESIADEVDEMKKMFGDAASSGRASTGVAGDMTKEAIDATKKARGMRAMTTGAELMDNILFTGKAAQGDVPTSFGANEIFQNKKWQAARRKIAERAKEGSVGAKVLDAMFNKSLKAYENIDQSYKLGTAVTLTKDGLSREELLRIGRWIKMEPSDIINKYNKGGEAFYRIDPSKAEEIANELYMNYNAMPGAVKVLRSMPLLGSPFVSFSFAMMPKIAKAARYNPDVFNKVSFAINEFGGQKSPLERKALEGPYANFLNQEGYARLPFFRDNPIYANLTNMIPYYSMNMFSKTDRKYKETIPNALISTFDKSQLMKDPVGSIIFDYFIQPMLLDKERPRGQFGQYLYQNDATLGEKAFSLGRALPESVVPGFAGLAGLAVPQSLAEYLPSYRMRQLSYAKAGKNQMGIQSKEPKTSRVARGVASTLGVGLHPVDLTFLSNEVKKSIK